MPRTKESKATILEKLIGDVETLYMELMELRHKSNELDDEEARSRYLTYQKKYYQEWIKTNQQRMQLRKETSKLWFLSKKLQQPQPQPQQKKSVSLMVAFK